MGVRAVSSYFPPRILPREKSQVEDEAQTTQSFSAPVMDHRVRPPSSKRIEKKKQESVLSASLSLVADMTLSLLFSVLFSAVFPEGRTTSLKYCGVAVPLTDGLYVQSEATLGNSLLCVSHSPWAKRYTGRTVAPRTFVSADVGICLTGATHGGCKLLKGGAPQAILSQLRMEKWSSGRQKNPEGKPSP